MKKKLILLLTLALCLTVLAGCGSSGGAQPGGQVRQATGPNTVGGSLLNDTPVEGQTGSDVGTEDAALVLRADEFFTVTFKGKSPETAVEITKNEDHIRQRIADAFFNGDLQAAEDEFYVEGLLFHMEYKVESASTWLANGDSLKIRYTYTFNYIDSRLRITGLGTHQYTIADVDAYIETNLFERVGVKPGEDGLAFVFTPCEDGVHANLEIINGYKDVRGNVPITRTRAQNLAPGDVVQMYPDISALDDEIYENYKFEPFDYYLTWDGTFNG